MDNQRLAGPGQFDQSHRYRGQAVHWDVESAGWSAANCVRRIVHYGDTVEQVFEISRWIKNAMGPHGWIQAQLFLPRLYLRWTEGKTFLRIIQDTNPNWKGTGDHAAS